MTTAERSGDHYVVNGSKKWITNGIFADYCTAAVRTGDPGRKGISALIIPLKTKGVTCRKIDNSGVHASGTWTHNSLCLIPDLLIILQVRRTSNLTR